MQTSPADKQDLYTILGLERTATETEIKKAYRTKALKWHPDKVDASRRHEAEDMFKRIKEAYEVLTDADRRKVYDRYGAASLEPGFHAPPEPESAPEPPYPQSPVYGQPQPQPSFPAPQQYPATPLNPTSYFPQYPQPSFAESYPAYPIFNGVPPAAGHFVPPFARPFFYDAFGNPFASPMGQSVPVPQPPAGPLPNQQPPMYFQPPVNPLRFPSAHPHGNLGNGVPMFPAPVPQPPSYSSPSQTPQPQQYQYSNGDYFAQNRQQWMPSSPPPAPQTPQDGSRAGTPTPQSIPRWMPQPPPQPPPGPTSFPQPPRPPPSAYPQQVPPPAYPQAPPAYPQQYMQSPPQTPPTVNGSSTLSASPVNILPERMAQWQQTPQNAPVPNPIPRERPRRPSLSKLKRRSTTGDFRAMMNAHETMEKSDRNSDRGASAYDRREPNRWKFKWGLGRMWG